MEKTSEGGLRISRFFISEDKACGLCRRMLLARMQKTLHHAEKQQRLLAQKNCQKQSERPRSECHAQKKGLENNQNLGA